MSFVVLTDSIRVVLPLRTRFETPAQMPILGGLMISQAKASGHCLQSFIELGQPGLPRPFRGERWYFEWRTDGENILACWLGFPNVFFSGGIDPNLRVAVEALGRFGTERGAMQSLARISITVKAREMAPGPGDISWMPENSPKTYPVF